jgi:protein SCO1/2
VRRALVAAAVAAAVALTGCGASEAEPGGAPVAGVTTSDPDGLNGIVLPEPYPVPDIALTATDGSSYTLAEDAEKPLTIVFFGYTHCPDICQVVMADIASALTRLEPEQREQVGLQFVTTDPARDDAAVLREYLDRFDPRFGGLTGDLPEIVELGEGVGIPIARGAKMPSGGYEVDHGTNILGMVPGGEVPLVWTQGTSADQLATDIAEVLDTGVPEVDDEGTTS